MQMHRDNDFFIDCQFKCSDNNIKADIQSWNIVI